MKNKEDNDIFYSFNEAVMFGNVFNDSILNVILSHIPEEDQHTQRLKLVCKQFNRVIEKRVETDKKIKYLREEMPNPLNDVVQNSHFSNRIFAAIFGNSLKDKCSSLFFLKQSFCTDKQEEMFIDVCQQGWLPFVKNYLKEKKAGNETLCLALCMKGFDCACLQFDFPLLETFMDFIFDWFTENPSNDSLFIVLKDMFLKLQINWMLKFGEIKEDNKSPIAKLMAKYINKIMVTQPELMCKFLEIKISTISKTSRQGEVQTLFPPSTTKKLNYQALDSIHIYCHLIQICKLINLDYKEIEVQCSKADFLYECQEYLVRIAKELGTTLKIEPLENDFPMPGSYDFIAGHRMGYFIRSLQPPQITGVPCYISTQNWDLVIGNTDFHVVIANQLPWFNAWKKSMDSLLFKENNHLTITFIDSKDFFLAFDSYYLFSYIQILAQRPGIEKLTLSVCFQGFSTIAAQKEIETGLHLLCLQLMPKKQINVQVYKSFNEMSNMGNQDVIFMRDQRTIDGQSNFSWLKRHPEAVHYYLLDSHDASSQAVWKWSKADSIEIFTGDSEEIRAFMSDSAPQKKAVLPIPAIPPKIIRRKPLIYRNTSATAPSGKVNQFKLKERFQQAIINVSENHYGEPPEIAKLDCTQLDKKTFNSIFECENGVLSEASRLLPKLTLEKIYQLIPLFEAGHWEALSDQQILSFDFTKIPERIRKRAINICFSRPFSLGISKEERLLPKLSKDQCDAVRPYLNKEFIPFLAHH